MGESVRPGAGGLDRPASPRFGPDGNLYVSCFSVNQVKRYNGRTGEYIDDFCGGNGLEHAGQMDFGPDGNLYVCSAGSNEVKRYNGRTGEFIDNFISAGSGGIDRPLGFAFGPGGILYLGDRSNAIKRYDARTGKFLGVWRPATVGWCIR